MGYIKTLKKLYKASGLSASLIIEVFMRRKSILVIVEKVDVGKPGLKIISDKGCFLLRKHHFDCYSNNWPSPDVAAGNFVAALRALNLQDRMTGLEQAVQPAVQLPSVFNSPLITDAQPHEPIDRVAIVR